MGIREKIGSARRALRKRRTPRMDRPCLGALSLPEDVLGGEARIVLCGSSRALAENVTRIESVAADCVRLAARRGTVTVRGSELELRDVREGALAVAGKIDAVELAGGSDAR